MKALKMKAGCLFLPLFALALGGWTGGIEQNTLVKQDHILATSEDVPAGEEVTAWLVLGKNGLYDNEAGKNFEEKFLENAVEFKAPLNSDLPGADMITSTVPGVTFDAWLFYDGGGRPTRYSSLTEDGMIVYASYVHDGSSVDPDNPPIEEADWYIVGDGFFVKEGQADWSVAGGVPMTLNDKNPSSEYTEYEKLGLEFAAGDVWKCCNKDMSIWVQIFQDDEGSAIAAEKMAIVHDADGNTNCQVKEAGKYDLYLKIFDDAKRNCIWAQPSSATV